MCFASSSPHLLPTRTSCRIPCLKAISSPRAPSHLPPYASAAQSARQRTTAYAPTSSSRTRPTRQELVSSSQTNWTETGWKLRIAVPETQIMPSDYELLNFDAEIYGASLKNDCTVYSFIFPLFPRRMRLAWHVHDQRAAQGVFERGARGPKYRWSSRSQQRM
jgi:hypothetical protein